MLVRAVSAETAGIDSQLHPAFARRSGAEGKARQLRFVKLGKGSFFTLFLGAAQAGLAVLNTYLALINSFVNDSECLLL